MLGLNSLRMRTATDASPGCVASAYWHCEPNATNKVSVQRPGAIRTIAELSRKNKAKISLAMASPSDAPGSHARRYSYSAEYSHVKAAQDAMKKDTFTKWINAHLASGGFDPVEELCSGLRDGIKLMQLMHVLTGQPIPKYTKNCMVRPQRLDNMALALDMIREAKIDPRLVHSNFIVDENEKMVMALVWTIIRRFSLERITTEQSGGGAESATSGAGRRLRGERGLLEWVRRSIQNLKPSVSVSNFSSDWSSGHVLCYLLHSKRPKSIDISKLSKTDDEANCALGLSVAESEFKVPQLVTVDELSQAVPDEASVMTYIATVYQKVEGETKSSADPRRSSYIVPVRVEGDLSSRESRGVRHTRNSATATPPGTSDAKTPAHSGETARLAAEAALVKAQHEKKECCDKEAQCQKEKHALQERLHQLESESLELQAAIAKLKQRLKRAKLSATEANARNSAMNIAMNQLRASLSRDIERLEYLLKQKDDTVIRLEMKLKDEQDRAERLAEADKKHDSIVEALEEELEYVKQKHSKELADAREQAREVQAEAETETHSQAAEQARVAKLENKVRRMIEEVKDLKDRERLLQSLRALSTRMASNYADTLSGWQVIIEPPPTDQTQRDEIRWLRDTVSDLSHRIQRQAEEVEAYRRMLAKRGEVLDAKGGPIPQDILHSVTNSGKPRPVRPPLPGAESLDQDDMRALRAENMALKLQLASLTRRCTDCEKERERLRQAAPQHSPDEGGRHRESGRGQHNPVTGTSAHKDSSSRGNSTPPVSRRSRGNRGKKKHRGTSPRASAARRLHKLTRQSSRQKLLATKQSLPALDINDSDSEPMPAFRRSLTLQSPRRNRRQAHSATPTSRSRHQQSLVESKTDIKQAAKRKHKDAQAIVALLNKFKKRRQNRGFVHLLNGFNERTCEIFFGTKNILLCLTRGALMVRIGGGFMPLGSFCKQFASREQARVDHERLKRRNSVPGTPSGMRRSSERVSAIAKSTPRLDSPRS